MGKLKAALEVVGALVALAIIIVTTAEEWPKSEEKK